MNPADEFPSTTSSVGLPEWIDSGFEFAESIEVAGVEMLRSAGADDWTWYHFYLAKLSPVERQVIVSMCEVVSGQQLCWRGAANFLQNALGEANWILSPQPDASLDYPDFDYEASLQNDYDQLSSDAEEEYNLEIGLLDLDPSDSEIDVGYRSDYDEDGTNWESKDESCDDPEWPARPSDCEDDDEDDEDDPEWDEE